MSETDRAADVENSRARYDIRNLLHRAYLPSCSRSSSSPCRPSCLFHRASRQTAVRQSPRPGTLGGSSSRRSWPITPPSLCFYFVSQSILSGVCTVKSKIGYLADQSDQP